MSKTEDLWTVITEDPESWPPDSQIPVWYIDTMRQSPQHGQRLPASMLRSLCSMPSYQGDLWRLVESG